MIYLLAPDSDRPMGGTKQVYRHASILRDAGVAVRILHRRKGFSYTWFEHDAPLAYLDTSIADLVATKAQRILGRRGRPTFDLRVGQDVHLATDSGMSTVKISAGDVVVLPEFLGTELETVRTTEHVVIFNQNVYGTFRYWGLQPREENLYRRSTTRGVLCVSAHNHDYLTYAFPGLQVERVVNGVDTNLFCLPELGSKKRQIAFMPRKLGHHLEQIVQILHQRGALDGWTLSPIEDAPESEVAKILKESAIFLSASHEEGFGLPPLEAALCGCLLVGYTGAAGAEYFLPELTWPVEQGDVLAFARVTESLLKQNETGEEEQSLIGRKLSQSLAELYSLEAERRSVLSAWRALCPEHFPGG